VCRHLSRSGSLLPQRNHIANQRHAGDDGTGTGTASISWRFIIFSPRYA
jgi:hypothetical protein